MAPSPFIFFLEFTRKVTLAQFELLKYLPTHFTSPQL